MCRDLLHFVSHYVGVAIGTINLTGQIVNTPSGTKIIGPFTILLPAATEVIVAPQLVIGNNGPYTVPISASYVLIVPPPTNISVLILKGATTGDVGLPINGQKPSLIGLDPTATAININSSTTVPSGTEISFY